MYDELFINSLRERYDISVLTFHPHPQFIPKGIEIIKIPDLLPPIDIHPFEGIRKHVLTPIRALSFKKYVARIAPDVTIGCWATTYGLYAAYSNQHPFVLFVWGSDVLVLPWKYPLFRTLVKYAVKKADIIVVASKVQQRVLGRLGCDMDKVVGFPWIKLTGFERHANYKTEVRTKFGWGEDDIVVISIRDHRPIYGVRYLIEAIPRILEREPKVKFLILGEGELTSQFKQEMKQYMTQNIVRFPGKIPHSDVAKFLNAADIYVSTSVSDGTSASLLEAMACATPPIVTAIPGNKDWIQDGWSGYLVPMKSASHLEKKILFLAKNEETRRQMAKNALRSLKDKKLDWQRNMDTLDEKIWSAITH